MPPCRSCFRAYPDSHGFLSSLPWLHFPLVTASVGLASKLFLRFGCKEVQVNGLDRFMSMLLDEKRRKEGRGLLTCELTGKSSNETFT